MTAPHDPVSLPALLAAAREQAAAVASLASSGADIAAPLEALHAAVAACGSLLSTADVTTTEQARRLLGEVLADITAAECHASSRLAELSAHIDDAALEQRRYRAYRSSTHR